MVNFCADQSTLILLQATQTIAELFLNFRVGFSLIRLFYLQSHFLQLFADWAEVGGDELYVVLAGGFAHIEFEFFSIGCHDILEIFDTQIVDYSFIVVVQITFAFLGIAA